MKKICIVGLKNLDEVGGIEKHVKLLLKQLSKNPDFEIHVVVNKNNKTRIQNVFLHKVGYLKNRFLLKISMLLASIHKIMKIKPDLIHAHDPIFGCFFSLFKIAPLVYTAHGIGYKRKDWPLLIRILLFLMEQITFKLADYVIAVDEETYKIISKTRKKSLEIIPNGIDVYEFLKKTEKPKGYKHQFVVLFIGRLIPSKGIYDAINAFSRIKNQKIGLYIIGKGPEEANIKKIAKEHNNIIFIGYVKSVVPYLQHADVFIMPSYYEGMPYVLLEAMAAGKPCVVYDIGDIRKRFKNGKEIIIVPTRNINALVDNILFLFHDEKNRKEIGENARKKIKKYYSDLVMTKKIMEIYKRVGKTK